MFAGKLVYYEQTVRRNICQALTIGGGDDAFVLLLGQHVRQHVGGSVYQGKAVQVESVKTLISALDLDSLLTFIEPQGAHVVSISQVIRRHFKRIMLETNI